MALMAVAPLLEVRGGSFVAQFYHFASVFSHLIILRALFSAEFAGPNSLREEQQRPCQFAMWSKFATISATICTHTTQSAITFWSVWTMPLW
jgi:hypothetical protein